MSFSKFSFTVPTTNTDGSPITGALSYTAYVDTVNPPVKAYPVPAANAPVAGVVTVTFADLGFVPIAGTTYFAAATDSEAGVSSVESNVVQFTYTTEPNPPTNFTVA